MVIPASFSMGIICLCKHESQFTVLEIHRHYNDAPHKPQLGKTGYDLRPIGKIQMQRLVFLPRIAAAIETGSSANNLIVADNDLRYVHGLRPQLYAFVLYLHEPCINGQHSISRHNTYAITKPCVILDTLLNQS